MGIYIKGMKMPDKATTIVVFPEGKARVFRQDIDHDEWLTVIEVPTSHGRLIDADAYHKEIRERYESAREWYNEAKDDEIIGRAEATMITFTECSLTLQHMPTIIEAEGT